MTAAQSLQAHRAMAFASGMNAWLRNPGMTGIERYTLAMQRYVMVMM